jgi:hypothetical protein
VGALLAAAGCATSPRSTGLPPLPVPNFRLAPAAPLTLQVDVPAPIFPWLVVSDFFPPGCHPIVPPHYRAPQFVDTPRAWFPSIAECTSSAGSRTLYHLGSGASTGMDYVVLVRNNNADTARPVFQIRKALEVLWSPDGSRAAITVLTGSNYADVVILRMDDLKTSDPIPTSGALEGYLSPYLIQAPQFVMALRWTPDGRLVLRARGSEPRPPFALFGYEVLVDTDHLDDPMAVRFLRGYNNARNPEVKPAVTHREPATAQTASAPAASS